MISFFPTPYPDELWYSVICRYHVHSGNYCAKHTMRQLYGDGTYTASMMLCGHIVPLLEQLPRGYLSIKDIILRHTLYPYYARFFSTQRKRSTYAYAFNGNADTVHRMGISQANGNHYFVLRYCPVCYQEDIYIPDEKLKIYGDLLRIITAQSMEYFSARPKGNKQMILFCLDEFASFGKLQITESLRKLRKRHIRIMVLTQSLADLDMIYGKDERKAMLGNFKFTILLGCKDTETQEYFSKMIGDKPSFGDDENKNNRPIIRPAELAHLEQDLYVICDDGAVRLRKNFYFKS